MTDITRIKRCDHCLTVAPADAKFCLSCGNPFGYDRPPLAQQPFPAPPATRQVIHVHDAGPQTMNYGQISIIFGGLGVVAWCVPLFGFPVGILAIVFGTLGMKTAQNQALWGIVLGALCLTASAINAIIGAVMGASGQL